jgi:sigma-E factor negative regulatory protein RseC
MAHTRGLVIKIKEGGIAQVVTDRKNACGGCGSTHSCHSCLSNSKMMTEALNRVDAKEGDLVDINLNSGLVLKGAAIMYLIPIAGIMIGALVGSFISGIFGIDETISAIIFSILGLCIGFMTTAFISKQMSVENRFTPIITQIIKLEEKHSPSSMGTNTFSKTKACSACH